MAGMTWTYLFTLIQGSAAMLETGHLQSWQVPLPDFDFTAKRPPTFIWSLGQYFPPYTLGADSLLITPGCDARYASVCAVQNAIKMITQARSATCSLLQGNASSKQAAINLLNSGSFIPVNTKYFGIFLLDFNFNIVVDQLRPTLVGQPIDGVNASGLTYQNGLRANINFSAGHGGGFVNRFTIRLRSDFGPKSVPVQAVAYVEGCPGLSYYLGVDIGRDPMPLVPNCPSTSNELCAVRNVNRVVGLMLVDFLALRYCQEFEMYQFGAGFSDKYRVNDFYGWSAEASTVALGHQLGLKDTIGTYLTYSLNNLLIGKNYSDIGDTTKDTLFGVGSLRGGDWRAYYSQTPDLGAHFQVTLVVGAVWDGIAFYFASMFSHIPRAPALGPQCLECNASEASSCAFKNAERLAGHHQADFLQSPNLSNMLWRTTNLKWLGALHSNSLSIVTGGVLLDRVFPEGFFVEVFSNTGVCLASGLDTNRVGKNMSQIAKDAGLRIDGTAVFKTLLNKGRSGGGWVKYIWGELRYARATLLYKWDLEMLSVVSVGSAASDGETCSAFYAEPCADKVIRYYVGAAMFAVANSNQSNVLSNLALVTGGLPPFGDPEGGFRVLAYDESWGCMEFLTPLGGVCPPTLNLEQRAALDAKLEDGGAWVNIVDDRGQVYKAFVLSVRKSLGLSFDAYDSEIRFVSMVKGDPPPPRCTLEDSQSCPRDSTCGSSGRCVCDFGFRARHDAIPGCGSLPAWTLSCSDVRGKMCDGSNCSPCMPGSFCPSGEKFPCSIGFYCPLGSSEPQACPVGRVTVFAGAASASYCELCPVGSIRSGVMRCQLCSPGMYQDAAGQSVCLRCPRGTYASAEGQDTCDACPVGKTTDGIGFVDPFSCSCPPGTYTSSENESCVSCGLGGVCDGFGALPESAPGYQVYDVLVDGLDVYRCGSILRCPGGPRPSCSAGRTGIACDSCLPGMSSRNDGTCVPCGRTDKTPFALVCLLCVALVTCTYIFVDVRPSLTTNHMVLFFVICCGQITTLNQTLAVAVKVGSFTWVDPLTPLIRAINVLTFDIEIIRVTCVVSISPFLQYISRVCIPIITFLYIIGVHLVNMLIVRRRSILSRFASLANTEGQFMMIFFISIITMITEPLQCLQHPNGLWTMVSFRSVRCWMGEEHTVMSVTAIFMLLVSLSFVALAMWVLLRYRARICVGDVVFLQTWSFMLFRFRPEARWCLLFFLGRSVLISLLPVVPVAILQVLSLHVVGLVTIFVALIAQPWRVSLGNKTEVLGGIWLMMFMMLTAFMVDSESHTTISTLAVVLISLVVSILPGTICYSFLRRYSLKYAKRFHFFISHHKQGAGCLARLVKHELALRPLKGIVFLDSDNLETLDTLFDIVGHQTRIVVALASASLLQRPWCVGEIAVAVTAKIGIYCIYCSDFVPPIPEYINMLEDHVEFSEISSYGVGIDLAKNAIACFLELPFIVLPDPLTDAIVHIVVGSIIKNNYQIDFSSSGSSDSKKGTKHSLVIIADLHMREAAAAGLLIIAMLGPKLTAVDNNDGISLWFEFGEGDQPDAHIPKSLHAIILLCTNNCWVAPQYIRAVLNCSTLGLPVLPVVVDSNYSYPTQSFYESLEGLTISLALSSGAIYVSGDLTFFVKQVFQTIAVRFDPQGDSKQLWKQGEDILRRTKNLWKKMLRARSASSPPNPELVKRESAPERGSVADRRVIEV